MNTELVTTEADRFCPVMNIGAAKQRRNDLVEYTQSIMVKEKDYGAIPGTDKPTLLKPGAEKLCSFFGLTVENPDIITEIEDWTGEKNGGEPFFYYKIRQRLTRNGTLIASQIASCNSKEVKYRYRWVSEQNVPPGLDKTILQTRGGTICEFDFAISKAETTGKYGKPAAYWKQFKDAILAGTARMIDRPTNNGKKMKAWEIGSPIYRVPNDGIFDQINTIQKMAEKRALVAACLIACNASEFFAQDLDDLEPLDIPLDTVPQAPRSHSKADQMAADIESHDAPQSNEGVDDPAPEDAPPIDANTGPDIGTWAAKIKIFPDYKTCTEFLKAVATNNSQVPQALKSEVENLTRLHMAELRKAANPEGTALPPKTEAATPKTPSAATQMNAMLLAQWRNAIEPLKTKEHCDEFRQFLLPTCPAEVREVVLTMLKDKEKTM